MTSSPQSDLSFGIDKSFTQIADNAPVMIWIAGVDKQLKWFSKYRSRFTGVPAQEELGLKWFDRVHPDDRELCVAAYNVAFDTRRPLRMEYRLRHVSGEYRWIFSHGVPHTDADGEFLGFVGCCTDVQELKSVQSRLQRDHEFLERLIDVGDRESEAVASALHDRVLQPLLAAKMHIQSLDTTENEVERAAENLDLASKLLSSVADECLQIINRTRPLIIDEQGVQVAIQDLIAELNEQNAVDFELRIAGDLGRLPRLWEGSLYWIAAEALQNVLRHSQASRVVVTITSDERVVTIGVQDDGVGFNPQQVDDEAFGLKAIEERTFLFGGKFQVEAQPGSGTTLTIAIPRPYSLDE